MHTPKKSFYGALKIPKSGGSKSSSPMTEDGGRFIPNRVSSNLKDIFEKAEREEIRKPAQEEKSRGFSELLHRQFFGNRETTNFNFLRYKGSQQEGKENTENAPVLTLFHPQPSIIPNYRTLPKAPYKILDAPGLSDDFYVDLLDWSSRNLISVGLSDQVYLWNAESAEVNLLCKLHNDSVTSVKWSETGEFLGIGTDKGYCLVYDVSRSVALSCVKQHDSRIGALAWNENLLTSGSREGSVINKDIRSSNSFTKIQAHSQEICGLEWSKDKMMLATGANDNLVKLWCKGIPESVGKLEGHNAAVKAIAWSPHTRGQLVTGGGTADKTIKLWNTQTLETLESIDTNSQVCNLLFSENTREVVSTHGYSENLVMLWSSPGLEPQGCLRGHQKRVLYVALSPDGENIVTGAADETLRFWRLFSKKQETPMSSSLTLSFENLR